jgi:hypothetical protein
VATPDILYLYLRAKNKKPKKIRKLIRVIARGSISHPGRGYSLGENGLPLGVARLVNPNTVSGQISKRFEPIAFTKASRT